MYVIGYKKMMKGITIILILIALISCNKKDESLKENMQIQSIENAYKSIRENLSYEISNLHFDIKDDAKYQKNDSCIQLLFNSHQLIINKIDSLREKEKLQMSELNNLGGILEEHLSFNKKVIYQFYNQDKKTYDKIKEYFESEYVLFNIDSVRIILGNPEEADRLFLTTLKLRILEFDKVSIDCLFSNCPELGVFIEPRVDFISGNDTVKIGQEYFGFAVCGINISKNAIEFKVNEIFENGKRINVNYSVDTAKNYIAFKYNPSKKGTVIFKGYGKYKNYKYGGLRFFPFEHTIFVKE
jgi:hypothetical protein